MLRSQACSLETSLPPAFLFLPHTLTQGWMAVFIPDTSALTVIYSTHSVRIDLSETFLPETQIPDAHGPCDLSCLSEIFTVCSRSFLGLTSSKPGCHSWASPSAIPCSSLLCFDFTDFFFLFSTHPWRWHCHHWPLQTACGLACHAADPRYIHFHSWSAA